LLSSFLDYSSVVGLSFSGILCSTVLSRSAINHIHKRVCLTVSSDTQKWGVVKYAIIENIQGFETLKVIVIFEVEKGGTIWNSFVKSVGDQNNNDFVHLIKVLFPEV
jgi:hypothetical protein